MQENWDARLQYHTPYKANEILRNLPQCFNFEILVTSNVINALK